MKNIIRKLKAVKEFIKLDKTELYYDKMCHLTNEELNKIGNESFSKYLNVGKIQKSGDNIYEKADKKRKISIKDLDDVLNDIYINGMKCGIRSTLSNIIDLCEEGMSIDGIEKFCKQTLINYKKGIK